MLSDGHNQRAVLRSPRSFLRIARSFRLNAQLLDAEWQDGKLRLRGYAYVRNRPAGSRGGELRGAWLRSGRTRLLPVRLRAVPEPEATIRSQQRRHNYDRSGFEAVVDPRQLFTGAGRTSWRLSLAIAIPGLLRHSGVGTAEAPVAPAPYRLEDGTRVVAAFEQGSLVLHAERPQVVLDGQSGTGDAVLLRGTVLDGAVKGPLKLRVAQPRGAADLTFPVVSSGTGFTVELPLSAFQGSTEPDRSADEQYSVRLVDGNGLDLPIDATGDAPHGCYPIPGTEGRRELCVTASSFGNLLLRDQEPRVLIDSARWSEDGEVLLDGRFGHAADRPLELIAQHSGSREEVAFPVGRDGERIHTRLRPDEISSAGGSFPLGEGNWYFFLREKDGDATAPLHALRLAPSQHAAVPVARTASDGRVLTLQRRFHDQLLLVSGSLLAQDERGGHNAERLKARYRAERTEPLLPAVLYSSFDGRQYSDSPRAVHEELRGRGTALDHVWVVKDGQARAPEGVRTVVHGSAAWHEALARSSHIVTNTQLPEWFERKDGQFVVQTWHGTPLKRIGMDLAGTAEANADYIASIPERSRQWNVLVTPNRFSTPHLKRSFGYQGEVLESGYPRSDRFHSPDRSKIAAQVRAELGIPEGKRVVLYAPTWRDDRRRGGGRYELDLQFDLEEAGRTLGDSTVVLLRRHYLVTDRLPGAHDGFVMDVSRYPDVAELMLVSDVLVTDYSSLMFDFAQTGRPILFHVHDLEHYRDTLRGFCFDFEATAPGPLLRDSAALVRALRDPEAAAAAHAEAYRAFRETFCDLDDGRAAARVVDRMLTLG